jgi:hypothetical protein
MREEVLEFTATGSPRVVSRAVEQFATHQGSLSAIIVPWESDHVTYLGNNLTRVTIAAHAPDHAEKQKLAALFEGFASQVQNRLQVPR